MSSEAERLLPGTVTRLVTFDRLLCSPSLAHLINFLLSTFSSDFSPCLAELHVLSFYHSAQWNRQRPGVCIEIVDA